VLIQKTITTKTKIIFIASSRIGNESLVLISFGKNANTISSTPNVMPIASWLTLHHNIYSDGFFQTTFP
jgi:hypothetical protein